MRKAVAAMVALAALPVASCTTNQISALQAGQLIANAQVPASDIIAAANAWDLLVVGATQYRVYCKANAYPKPLCSNSNRIAVIKWSRAGKAARNKLEDILDSGAPVGPMAAYQTLITAYQALNQTPASSFVAPK